MPQDRHFHMPQRTPEHAPRGVEGEDLFDEALSGTLELPSIGRTTPIDFIRLASDEMEKFDLELTENRVVAILNLAFGSREQARDRISEMTGQAFGETYPDVYGRLVRWYIEPPTE